MMHAENHAPGTTPSRFRAATLLLLGGALATAPEAPAVGACPRIADCPRIPATVDSPPSRGPDMSSPAMAPETRTSAVSSFPATLTKGRKVFLTFCAGCHGFDGLASYPPAPSFSMGERLHKSDSELLKTILEGKNQMPSWEAKLPRAWLEQAIGYLRYMAVRAKSDEGPVDNDMPPLYFIFYPDADWQHSDW